MQFWRIQYSLFCQEHLPNWRQMKCCSTLEGETNRSNTTFREGRGNPIQVSKICNPRQSMPSWDFANLGHEDRIPSSLPQCGDWLFFSFWSKNVQNRYKTHTRCNFSRLFGIDVLWLHRWFTCTSGIGMSYSSHYSSLVVYYKSWTLGWEFLVPPSMRW